MPPHPKAYPEVPVPNDRPSAARLLASRQQSGETIIIDSLGILDFKRFEFFLIREAGTRLEVNDALANPLLQAAQGSPRGQKDTRPGEIGHIEAGPIGEVDIALEDAPLPTGPRRKGSLRVNDSRGGTGTEREKAQEAHDDGGEGTKGHKSNWSDEAQRGLFNFF